MSKHRRPDYSALMPYLVLEDAKGFHTFCQEVIGMTIDVVDHDESGAIRHSLLRLEDSCVEVSDTRGQRAPMPAMLHCYVNDLQHRFEAAVAAGCEVIMPPTEMDYGEISCGLKDPWGVEWWLASFQGE